jgi:hypothetical protein
MSWRPERSGVEPPFVFGSRNKRWLDFARHDSLIDWDIPSGELALAGCWKTSFGKDAPPPSCALHFWVTHSVAPRSFCPNTRNYGACRGPLASSRFSAAF